MKKIQLITVGKIKEKYWTDAIGEYAKRLTKFCDFRIIEVPDCADSPTAQKAEAKLLVPHLSTGYNIALAINGTQISSPELAAKVDKIYTNGDSCINFVIGGSTGLDTSILALMKESISLGRVTYPHQLVRVMMSEQIYRAFSILGNSPYHK